MNEIGHSEYDEDEQGEEEEPGAEVGDAELARAEGTLEQKSAGDPELDEAIPEIHVRDASRHASQETR